MNAAISTSVEADSAFASQDRCPACGGERFVVVGPSAPSNSVVVAGRTFTQPAFEARRCRNCGLVFKSRIASADVLSDYYSSVDFARWNSAGLLPPERIIVEVLSKLPPASRVLDFGCSVGRILSRLVDRHQCFGIEINAEAAKVAASRGIKMLSVDDLTEGGPTFDAILAVDIFEHLTAPLELLGKLASRLEPGGKLLVCTGNSDAPSVRGEPATCWYLDLIEHLCMLNPEHARYIAGALGLTLAQSHVVSHYDASLKLRFKQRLYAFAFEGFHRSNSLLLRTILSAVPFVNRARRWTKRPTWDRAADHLVLVFEKPPAPPAPAAPAARGHA